MIYSSTELETTDEGSVTLSELAKYLRNSKEFKDITDAFDKIDKFSDTLYKTIEDIKKEVEAEEEPHTHSQKDIVDLVLFSKEEAEELISKASFLLTEKINSLKTTLEKLPDSSKQELDSAIQSLRKEIEGKLQKLDIKPVNQTTIINKVEESRLKKIEKNLLDITSLLDSIVDKAEEDLRNVQQKLLSEFAGKIKESNKKVTIVGGVNPALNRFLELLDVDTANLQNGYVAAYNSVTKKMEFVPQASGGGIESVVAGTNISVDNTDPTNPIINSLSDRYKTTSSTSNTIVSSGSLTFTVDAGLSYIPMQEVLIVHDASNHMHASITSYSGTTMIVDVKHKTGSGTYSSWTINLDGTPVDALTGSGTVGELATFTGAQVLGSTPIKTINGESIIGSGNIVTTDTYSFTFYGGF